MGSIRIEGDPLREIPRELYDQSRTQVASPKAVCHAPFGALHVLAGRAGRAGREGGDARAPDASFAPCRHSRLPIGSPNYESIAEVFDGDAARALRERFRHYVVRREECGACVQLWEDGVAAESPAVAEFDRALPPVNGVPPMLRSLSVQSSARLPQARVLEMVALLPQLTRLDILCDAAEPGPLGLELLDAIAALPAPQRPKVRLLVRGAVPEAHALADCVEAVELELPLARGGLPPDVKTALTSLVGRLAERGAALRVRCEVGRSDWIELRSWLADVLACGATPTVTAKAKDDADSLAALDGDLLSTLHTVLYRWSVELGVAQEEQKGAYPFSAMLKRLRAWQKQAAERAAAAAPAPSPADGVGFAAPALDHPLLADEGEARRLLFDFLRVYHDARVEAWLAGVSHHPDFVRGARERCALRLVALWLGCVFERSDARPLLRAIYADPATAARLLAADRPLLAGTPIAGWHDGWTRSLALEVAPRGAAPFALPPPKRPARGRVKLTVIIPSFNHERFVGPAIDSVLAQEGLNVRVVVVDDRSRDGTVAAARSRRDPRVTVRVNRKNLGLGESLHRALKRVRTPFVAILNSDDLFHPRRLEKCVAALERKPAAAVAATLLAPVDGEGRACTTRDSSPIFDGKKVSDWLRWFETLSRTHDAGRDLLAQLLEGNFLISTSNIVCRRDWLVERADRWRDLDWCVDWQVFLLAALEGSLRVVQEPLLAYRLHASNTVWFDEELKWRFYVESHRVVARALEQLVARARGPADRRFKKALAVVAGPLAANGAIDWAGVYLGMLLERLAIPAKSIGGEECGAWFKALEKLRDARQHARDLVTTLGDDLPALLRMRGEQPWLRADRNRFEAVGDELERMRWDLQHAVQERGNAERLRRSAEVDRDREAADKKQLYQRIGEIEAEVDRVRREGAARVEEVARELAARAEPLRQEIEQARAALEKERVRARRDLDAERADAADRLEGERRRLLSLMGDERARSDAVLEGERQAHAQALAAALRRHEERLADLTRRFDDEVSAARRLLAQVEAEARSLRDLVNQRTRERDEMARTPEFRVGDVVVNKLRLKRPLRAVETRLHKSKIVAANALLRAERRGLIHSSKGLPRVFATICWNFPIYSQTFVYQELLQLKKRGFDLRLIYSKLDPHDHLNAQFEPLWRLKRTMHLDRAVHERDYMLFKARFPERVEEITQRICAAAGMSREALTCHANFLQGFSYARLAESWGAEYLHSYFFYDRSLMSLIAGHVLNKPRGVTCYADHLLKDYELKVVPLHLQTCDIVIATSHRIKRELLALAPDVKGDKILVKPNAIDCNRFPVIPRAEPADGQPFRIVVTSRLEPKKGLIYLVEAMRLLRDAGVNVECHLVGDADQGVPASENCKAELCERIERLQLAGKVHVEGRQNEQGVRRFLAMSHLFVAPFIETDSGDKDGIPTALVEALATGIPCVVTDAGSMLEVVDDRVDARVVGQRDPRALADAIRDLLADPARRLRMAQKAAQKARERFDVAVCEPNFHDRIRAVLRDRKP